MGTRWNAARRGWAKIDMRRQLYARLARIQNTTFIEASFEKLEAL